MKLSRGVLAIAGSLLAVALGLMAGDGVRQEIRSIFVRGATAVPTPTAGPGATPSAGPSATPTAPAARFDQARAFAHLERQVAFGPRVPGSAGHAATRTYILEQLRASADDVVVQPFPGVVPTGTIPMTNLIGIFGPARTPKVVLAAHWDTRPTADQDPDPANRSRPIPGANDGASGVAVLLEVARVLALRPPAVGVAVVLFDGEDYGPGEPNMYLGSKYYAEHLVPERPAYAVVVDMVCQRNLSLPVEGFSFTNARAIVDKVWSTAERLGYAEFRRDPMLAILDDHVPLQRAGIPAIDVIDFTYPWWHTLLDTPDKCDPRSLERVGTVLLETLWAETGR
ncbi:MAG: M28 family peptidase [Chloroflexi bacterium]|nr:M28 family peptidase [Chloroflexota bacterium]